MSNQSSSSKTDDASSDSPTSRNTETCGITTTSANTTIDDDVKAKISDTSTEEETLSKNPDQKKKVHRRIAVKVNRPVYTQSAFDEGHDKQERHSKSVWDRLQRIKRQCTCSSLCVKRLVCKFFPFVTILKGYSPKDDLLNDLIAGLTVGIMHIPQGIAYGVLAQVAAVYGLYVSFFPVLIYFFFGTSRHISLGTFAVMSLMIGTVVDKADCDSVGTAVVSATTVLPSLENSTQSNASAAGKDEREIMACKLGVATAVTLMTGLYQIAMGLLQLGFVTIYLSEPLTRGFTTGAAIHVFTSQIRNIFAIPVSRKSAPFKLIKIYVSLLGNIASINWASLIMGVICIIVMVVVKEVVNPKVKKKIRMPVPIELLVVIGGTIVSYFGSFEDNFNMKVVGEIPTGIPPPKVPPVDRLGMVAVDAVSLAIVAFAINVSLAKLFAKKHGYEVDTNQELVAYGITNGLSSFLNCYVSSASLSRSLVQEGVGGRTQIAGLVSCGLLLIVLFAIGPLFQQLPSCVLAAIIIVNLKGMFEQFADLKRLWYISKLDFLVWIVAFLAVVLLDVDLGLFVGIAFNLLTVVFRTQRPYTCVLGRVPHTDIYKDKSVYSAAHEIPGVKIFRFEASLYYANSEHFVSKLFSKSGINPRKLKAEQVKIQEKNQRLQKEREKQQKKRCKNHVEKDHIPDQDTLNDTEDPDLMDIPQTELTDIVIDCTTMGYVDSVGVSTLSQMITEYQEVGTEVCLCGCKAGVREVLETAGFFEKMPRSRLYLSVHDAVLAILQKNPVLLEELRSDSQGLFQMGSVFTLVGSSIGNERSPPPVIHRLRSLESPSEQLEPLLEQEDTEV